MLRGETTIALGSLEVRYSLTQSSISPCLSAFLHLNFSRCYPFCYSNKHTADHIFFRLEDIVPDLLLSDKKELKIEHEDITVLKYAPLPRLLSFCLSVFLCSFLYISLPFLSFFLACLFLLLVSKKIMHILYILSLSVLRVINLFSASSRVGAGSFGVISRALLKKRRNRERMATLSTGATKTLSTAQLSTDKDTDTKANINTQTTTEPETVAIKEITTRSVVLSNAPPNKFICLYVQHDHEFTHPHV